MKLKPGQRGKIVRTLVPERILFNTRLRDWYDSNPYRIFDGRDEDSKGNPAVRDVLILKNDNLCFSNARPVIVVNGCNISSSSSVYKYNVTVYFDADKACDELTDGAELSIDGKRASMPLEFIKSNLERNYKRVARVSVVSDKTLDDAVKLYDTRRHDAELIAEMLLQRQYFGFDYYSRLSPFF